ncbi:hypothetical protein RRG08_017170 [Elysia crispata]|uniref:Uncharacterized protein n=1 Tax=Elysia crispata TaxID=231223 RepID=A0AAE1E9B3_9GAST|nr:hypothetical protein RRG08_017170 [Elysia crispata]
MIVFTQSNIGDSAVQLPLPCGLKVILWKPWVSEVNVSNVQLRLRRLKKEADLCVIAESRVGVVYRYFLGSELISMVYMGNCPTASCDNQGLLRNILDRRTFSVPREFLPIMKHS